MKLLDRFFGKHRCTLCGKRTKVAGCCYPCVSAWLEERPIVDKSCNDFESVLKLLNDAVDKFDKGE